MPVTDEDAAIQAIASLDPLSKDQQDAKENIDSLINSPDPFIDIHILFSLYNTLYFQSLLLPRVEVSWSPRLTLCAGICELVRDPANNNKYTRIRLKLSEPLLKFRPRSDTINTLLHEAIHAYFFITTSWRHSRGDDGTGHGSGFLLLADAINNHGNYDVTVYHTFHDEVESYRTHVWQCDGPCQSRPPFFGQVRRSMNRAPGKSDQWWQRHQDDCGGTFEKVAEPEMTKERIEKLSGLKKAGRQKNKIDQWAKKPAGVSAAETESPTTGTSYSSVKMESGASNLVNLVDVKVSCPICAEYVVEDAINDHLDSMHPPW